MIEDGRWDHPAFQSLYYTRENRDEEPQIKRISVCYPSNEGKGSVYYLTQAILLSRLDKSQTAGKQC